MPPELSKTPDSFVVKARMEGKRIDAYLASRFQDYSRSVIQKVIDAGAVLVNGQPVKASYKVREGRRDPRLAPRAGRRRPVPEDIPLEVVYEDEAFTVVNKPPGMVTHPAKGHWTGTLVNAPPVPLRHPLDPRPARTGRGSSTGSTATPRGS